MSSRSAIIELDLPAVWFTPVLTSEWVVDAPRRATAAGVVLSRGGIW